MKKKINIICTPIFLQASSLPQAWYNRFLQSRGEYERNNAPPAFKGRSLVCPSYARAKLKSKYIFIYMRQYEKDFVVVASPRNGTKKIEGSYTHRYR